MELPKHITVLPADIRYRTDLTPFARVLYSEIFYHELQFGYFCVSNTQIAEWYNCTTDTVSRTISELKKAGVIMLSSKKPRSFITVR
jgi:DNA-binding transcriptional regulator YhcF (GntR family)